MCLDQVSSIQSFSAKKKKEKFYVIGLSTQDYNTRYVCTRKRKKKL